MSAATQDGAQGVAVERVVQQSGGLPASILSDVQISQVWRIAKSLAEAQVFKDARQANIAFAKILIGRDLGLTPAQSLMGLDIVEGNLQVRGVLLGQFVRRHALYDYKIKEQTSEAATVFLYMRDDTGGWPVAEEDELFEFPQVRFEQSVSPGTTFVVKAGKRLPEGVVRFTVTDAKRAGLVKAKSNWEKYPGNMCVWRSLSNAVKFYAPELTAGIPVYTEADSLPGPVEEIGGGEGAAAAAVDWPGLTSTHVKDVETVLRRAVELGHAGLARRDSARIALNGQPPSYVEGWLQHAVRTLDQHEAARDRAKSEDVTDADVVADEHKRAGHVTFTESNLVRRFEHAGCGFFDGPLTDPRPVDGEVVRCRGCGETLPVKVQGGERPDAPAPAGEAAAAPAAPASQPEPQVATGDADQLMRQSLQLLAESESLAEADPERSRRLEAEAWDLKERSEAITSGQTRFGGL